MTVPAAIRINSNNNNRSQVMVADPHKADGEGDDDDEVAGFPLDRRPPPADHDISLQNGVAAKPDDDDAATAMMASLRPD